MKLHETIKKDFVARAGQLFRKGGVASSAIADEMVKVCGKEFQTKLVIEYLETGKRIGGGSKRKYVENPKNEMAMYSHCEFCGKELPEDEIAMGAANHRDCWRKDVLEKRSGEPSVSHETFPHVYRSLL